MASVEAKELDDYPEVATTEAWRSLMRRARIDHGMHQKDLAAKVGVTQALISNIESGGVGQSKAVMPICEALGIQPPHAMFEDETEQRWFEVGRVLRTRKPDNFKALLSAAEHLIAQSGEPKDQ
jgi:transcriptional regulator with XRE-family HTH domain